MSTLASCPNPGQLRKLMDGSATPEEQAALARHLDGCPHCQAALERLSAGQGSWDDIVPHLAEPGEPVEPALARAMDALQAGAPSETSAQPGSDGAGRLEFLDPPEKAGQIGRLGDHEILEVVGTGGMGIVLKAFDPKLHRVVAIKVMSPQLAGHVTGRKRFQREAQAAAAVTHEHVVTIHAVEETKGLPYLVMQYISGRSLQQRVDDCGAMELKEILRIGMQTASGLAAAHAQGLVHRDIKPANILLENGIERVKITDFGLARASDDARVTQSGVVTGTPQYMSPEQAGGKAVDHRADLFSLGGVLYAMCTGYAPFRASSTMAVLKKVCDEMPRPIGELNPEIPDWLVAIVEKLMSKEPKARFQSAAEVATLLGQHLAHLQQPTVFPQPAEIARPPKPSVKKQRSNAGVTVAIVAVVVLVMLFCLVPVAGMLLWLGYSTVAVDRKSGVSGDSVAPLSVSEEEKRARDRVGGGLRDIALAAGHLSKASDSLVDGLDWFPEETTFCAAYSFSEAPKEITEALWGLARSMPGPVGGPGPIARIADSIGGGTISRLSFAYVEDPAGQRSRHFMRLSGLWNRDRVINALAKGNEVRTLESPQPGGEKATIIVHGEEFALVVIGSSDILLGGYGRIPKGSKGHEEVVRQALDCKASSKRNLRHGPLGADLATVPGNAFCMVAGEPPMEFHELLKAAHGALSRKATISLSEGKGDGAANTLDPQGAKQFVSLSFNASMNRAADAENVLKHLANAPQRFHDSLDRALQDLASRLVSGPDAQKAFLETSKQFRSGPRIKVESKRGGLLVQGNIAIPPTVWRAALLFAREPLADRTPAIPIQMLKKFDPRVDRPIQTEVDDRKVSVEEDAWRIEARKAPPSGPGFTIFPEDLRLFELPKQNVQHSTVVLRFKMKTAKVTLNANVGLSVGGQPVWLGQEFKTNVKGTTNWKSYEVRYECKDNVPKDLLVLAAIGGTGTMWLKDLELIKVPLPLPSPLPARQP